MNILEVLKQYGNRIKRWWRRSKVSEKKYFYADRKEKPKVYIGQK